MKIAIVSGSFYPAKSPRSYRTTELAEEFLRLGHEVAVWFPSSGYCYEEYAKEYKNLSLHPITSLRWRKKQRTTGRIAAVGQRIFRHISEFPDIEWYFRMPEILAEAGSFDLLISIAAPHPIHWGINRTLKRMPDLSKVWIADCGDPFMGATIEKIRKPFYFSFFEKSFCRRADYITVPTEGAVVAYYPRFREKIRVIPQGFKMDNIVLAPEIGEHPATISFAYAGGLSLGVRDPSSLLDYLIEEKKDFRVVVYTKQKELLNPYKKILGDRLKISDYIERKTLLYELSKNDFLLNFDNGTSRQTPSKLIDYAIVGKPVLNVDCNHLDKQTINEFLARNYANALSVPSKDHYDITRVAKQFLELLDEK